MPAAAFPCEPARRPYPSIVRRRSRAPATLRGSYARVKDGEVWLEGAHIAEYEQGTYMNHEPTRPRKLLLHRREIDRLVGRVQAKGETLIPLKLYFSGNRAKVEIGLCRGKK